MAIKLLSCPSLSTQRWDKICITEGSVGGWWFPWFTLPGISTLTTNQMYWLIENPITNRFYGFSVFLPMLTYIIWVKHLFTIYACIKLWFSWYSRCKRSPGLTVYWHQLTNLEPKERHVYQCPLFSTNLITSAPSRRGKTARQRVHRDGRMTYRMATREEIMRTWTQNELCSRWLGQKWSSVLSFLNQHVGWLIVVSALL